MAGLKLKSGADFCNFEAFRMRLHNAGEDPTSDFGVGQIYFNTSDTSVGSARHVRLYDGTKFRSLAYLDDVDSRIKTIEDMLSVDTAEGVVSTWNEIQEFLDSVQEGTDLMDLLNGKLNTSGGTINGNLLIGAPDNTSYRYLQFARRGYGSRLNIADGNLYVSFGGIDANGGLTATKSLSIGNNGLRFSPDQKTYYDILTSAGGTIEGDIATKSFASGTDGLGLYIEGKSTVGIRIQYDKSGTGNDYDQLLLKNGVISWNNKPLLHSGNVGDYAMKTNKKLDIQTSVNETGYAYTSDGWRTTGAAVTIGASSDYRMAFQGDYGSTIGMRLQYGYCNDGEWKGWKTIAFTDSNVASAYRLLTKEDRSMVYLSDSGNLVIGDNIATGATHIIGNNVLLRYGANAANGLILNSSGNVTIGASDLAGTDAKLYVDGVAAFGTTSGCDIFLKRATGYNYLNAAHSLAITVDNNTSNIALTISKNKDATFFGDLHVTGNIIADGEVSAGGRAEEGGNAGGGGAFYSDIIKKGATQTTIAHGLGTDDIVVSIYEKDGVSGRWSIILTDVEIVDANNIIVSFGSATSVEHKVVIMGAVA